MNRMDPVKKHHGRLAIPAKEGKLVSMGGIGVKFKISGDETNRAFSIVEHPVQPRTLVPPHLHHDTDEYSYVVEGQFGARIGDEILLAGPGEYILKPRGIPHTFWNPTDKVARLVEIISPAGFEKFFAEAGDLFLKGPPELEQVKAALETPSVQRRLLELGNTPRWESPEQFRQTVKSDRQKWASVVKEVGATID